MCWKLSVFMSVLPENPIQQANIDTVKQTRLKSLCTSNTWEVSANLEAVWTVVAHRQTGYVWKSAQPCLFLFGVFWCCLLVLNYLLGPKWIQRSECQTKMSDKDKYWDLHFWLSSRFRSQTLLWFSADLFEHLPVIVVLAHHHGLQLLRPEEVHYVHFTHLEEPPLELFEHSLHWFVEGMVDIGVHKLFPVRKN